MQFLYAISIILFGFAIRVASIWSPKAKKWIQGRKDLLPPSNIWNETGAIWFHCASVGEFEQGFPVYERIRDKYPDKKFIFSFFSPSGYEYVRMKHPTFCIFYLPLDTPSNARKLVEMLQPEMVFFVKYEFWRNILLELSQRKIPVFLISGIFRQEQIFFKPYGGFFRKILHSFTQLFVQNEESKKRLISVGITPVSVTGDSRFERVTALAGQPFRNDKIEAFAKDRNIFVAGSIWNSDLEILQKIIQKLPESWKIILVPHDPDHIRYSFFPVSDRYTQNNIPGTRILWLDTLGMLSKTYRFASLSYVGGGFDKGIHNVLEAAVYKTPVLIGPRFRKFTEATELRETGILQVLKGTERDYELKEIISRMISDKPEIRQKCETYFMQKASSSHEILKSLEKMGLFNVKK